MKAAILKTLGDVWAGIKNAVGAIGSRKALTLAALAVVAFSTISLGNMICLTVAGCVFMVTEVIKKKG